MEIHCGECTVELKHEDLVIMNQAHTLTHSHCYKQHGSYIKDTGTYEHIKNKYWFYKKGVEQAKKRRKQK
ncbi:hypothetical protein BC6307_17860 [Sutcliffiella cohnii]|uniref:Uncharacterized protein n=1 Tax=Sutcliffiella cohnii TaxID=33932 RepID=A0A223KUJ6_9BACI|nr:hypothetical protein BC6307_17860 [Sutcliffiella cohnii]